MLLTVNRFVHIIRRMAIECAKKSEFIALLTEYKDFVFEPGMCIKGGADKLMKYLEQ